MNPMELYINNQLVADWAEWPATTVVVQRDEENLTVAAQLENIKLINPTAAQLAAAPLAVLSLELRVAGESIRGRVYPGEVLYGRDYVVLSAELDDISLFTRLVEGRLLDESVRRDVRVLVSPREDRALAFTLLISAFILTYITVKELFELGRDAAVIAGITGAGIGGLVSGPLAAAIIAALRAVYIAALVVALVELVRELLRLVDRIITVRGFRLGDALRYFANAAGMQVQYPSFLDKVWIICGGQEAWEAGEVFRIAKQLTNSVLRVRNNTITLAAAAQQDFPAPLRVAWEEAYRLDLLEVPRRELISLVRDTAEGHCLDVPAAAEIIRQQGRGFRRVDIPLAPAQVAGERREVEFIRKFLRALGVFSAKIRNIAAQYQGYQNIIIVERDIFTPKVVYAADPEEVPSTQAAFLLQLIAQRYQRLFARRKVENITQPLSAAQFAQLSADGFPGVQELRWYPAEERAEISYKYKDISIPLNEQIKII